MRRRRRRGSFSDWEFLMRGRLRGELVHRRKPLDPQPSTTLEPETLSPPLFPALAHAMRFPPPFRLRQLLPS
jgi:hypothetical protein